MNLVDIADRSWRAIEPCGVLVSYFAVRNGDVEAITAPWRERGVPVFCDSGAFGALSAKTVIDVHDYKTWLLEHRDLFDVIANLDVIGSVEGSDENMRVLVDAGLPVLPVFHVGEPWDVLDRMANDYDRVALGGMVSFRRGGNVGSWISDAFRLVNGRAQLHGFGVTRWQFLRDFPWDTVDSTTWLSGARYGALLVWNGSRLIQLDRKGLVKLGERALREAHDVSLDQAIRGANGDHAIGYRISLRAMAIAQQRRRVHVPGFTIYCSGVI